MRIPRFVSFAAGAVFTISLIGAVQYVQATNDAQIKACANKSTGALRLLTRGKCSTKEKTVNWNQRGIQGLNGPKGDTGANGQNFYAIDANGRQVGQIISVSQSSNIATIIYEGGLWDLSVFDSFPKGRIEKSAFYLDSSCSVPLVVSTTFTSMDRGWNGDSNQPKYWKPTGERFTISERVVYGIVITGTKPNQVFTCTSSTQQSFQTYFQDELSPDLLFSQVIEVTPPSYLAPFAVVSR